MTNGMKCYTYKLTLISDPRYYYYGVRNIYKKDPEHDRYYGSGNSLKYFRKIYGNDCFSKEVLKVFNDRKECLEEEHRLVGNLWSTDPFCLNRMPGGAFAGNFDLSGKHVIHNKSGEIRFIDETNLKLFLDSGWKKGLPDNSGQKKRLGQICIHKGIAEKHVYVQELMKYEKEGWIRGRSKRALEHLCRIHMTDGEHDINVRTEEEQQYWEQRGWYRGHSKQHIENSANSQKNLVWMSKGQEMTRVYSSEVESHIRDGWVKGHIVNRTRKKSEEELKKISTTQRGRVWVNNGSNCRHVWPGEIESLKKQGWQEGRLKGQTPDTTGLIRIFRGSERKAIKSEDLGKYISEGWTRGRGF